MSRRLLLATATVGASLASSRLGLASAAEKEPPEASDEEAESNGDADRADEPSASDSAAAKKKKSREAERYRLRSPGSDIETGGAIIGVRGSMEQVLEMTQQYHRYTEILPRMEQSRIIAKRNGHTDVYLRAPILRGVAHVWGVARFSPPQTYNRKGKRIVGRYVKGNLDGWHGQWKLYPCKPNRTILWMEMFVDLSIPVPNSLITPELMWAADMAVTAVRDMVECGASTVTDN